MYDISAANIVKVVFLFEKGGFGSTFEFYQKDFAADSTPIRISPNGIVRSRIDFDGKLVPQRHRTPIRVQLSPIPNTDSELKLKKTLIEARNNCADPSSPVVIRLMKITFGSASEAGFDGGSENRITLEDGYPVDGGIGIDLNPEGRFATQPYFFEFADINGELDCETPWMDYEATPDDEEGAGEGGEGESGETGKDSDTPEKKRKRKYGLKGTSGFTPLTTTGKQMMQPNWNTPLTTNKWFG